MKQRVRTQRGVQVMHQDDVRGRIQTFALGQHSHARQYFFKPLMARFRDVHLVGFFVHPIIALALFVGLAVQQFRNFVDANVGFSVIFGRVRR